MASVVRKRKSQFWYACFSLPDGRRRQSSTRTTDKKKAQQIAWAAEEAARSKATEDQARAIISRVVEEIHGHPVSNETCGEYFDRWLVRRSRELAGTTIDRMGDVFRSLKGFLGKGWEKPLSELSQAQLADWRDGLAEKYAVVTANLYLKIVAMVLRDAWNDGKIVASPAEKLKALKLPRGGSSKKVFTPEQFQSLISVSDGEWRGMIIAGAFTGQRLSDIACMKLAEIDGDWWRFKTRKTGSELALPLAESFTDWISKWIKARKIASEFVFPDACASIVRCKGKPSSLSNQFYRVMSTAGLVPKRDNNVSKGIGRGGRRESSELSFHSFRHTCATWLKMQGVAESVAMGFVGHQTKAISRHYTHVPETELMAAMKKMERFSAVA